MRNCLACGAPFRPRGGHNRYCSRECGIPARSGKNAPTYKGGSVNHNGYKLICISGKRMLEHRHVMEVHLKRKLEPGEVVHHKDHNRLNNSLDNLELIPTHSIHLKQHLCTGYRSETQKECSRCHVIKLRTEFNLSTGRLLGRLNDRNTSECKACRAIWYVNNRHRLKDWLKRHPAEDHG